MRSVLPDWLHWIMRRNSGIHNSGVAYLASVHESPTVAENGIEIVSSQALLQQSSTRRIITGKYRDNQ